MDSRSYWGLPRQWLRPGLLWIGFDLLVPTALLYIALWFGASLYLAFLVSGALSAVTSLLAWRRGTAGQRFAPQMLLLSIVGFGIALITGSDRFLLAKESVLTAMVGCWFLGSIWTSRPLAYQFSRPLLEGRFGLPVSWDDLWDREPRFRRIWRVVSVMWAIATMADAVIRVVMAYTLPINAVPVLQAGLMVATVVLMQPITHIYFARAGLWKLLHEHAWAK